MKKIILLLHIALFLFGLVNGNNILAQQVGDDLLFETKATAHKKVGFDSKNSHTGLKVKKQYSIDFNKNVLFEKESITFKIENSYFNVTNKELKQLGADNFSFTGSTGGKTYKNVMITYRNNFVYGTIYTDTANYQIVTEKDGSQYIMEFDESGLVDCEPMLPTGYDNNAKTIKLKSAQAGNTASTAMQNKEAATINSCAMRIIVLYTPDVDSIVGDMLTLMQNTIDESNRIIENTIVPEKWELAYAGMTEYTEAPGDGRFTDLARFRTNNDGYMDEVHALRELYSADVCMLLSECQDPYSCGGVASTIDASYSTAFALTHYMQGYFPSFHHEIGHLLAGLHHNSVGSYPYPYGHGMYLSEINSKTQMGYIWGPTWIPFFTNPDLSYNGYTIGTTDWNDMGRVLEQEIPEKAHFLQPENTVTVTSADIENMIYADVISEESVILEDLTVPGGSYLKVRTGEVTINSEFTLELGAEFEIVNEQVLDCP